MFDFYRQVLIYIYTSFATKATHVSHEYEDQF